MTLYMVFDDSTRDANPIGVAETEDEAARVFMDYMQDRMFPDDFAELKRPMFRFDLDRNAFEPVL